MTPTATQKTITKQEYRSLDAGSRIDVAEIVADYRRMYQTYTDYHRAFGEADAAYERLIRERTLGGRVDADTVNAARSARDVAGDMLFEAHNNVETIFARLKEAIRAEVSNKRVPELEAERQHIEAVLLPENDAEIARAVAHLAALIGRRQSGGRLGRIGITQNLVLAVRHAGGNPLIQFCKLTHLPRTAMTPESAKGDPNAELLFIPQPEDPQSGEPSYRERIDQIKNEIDSLKTQIEPIIERRVQELLKGSATPAGQAI